MIVKTSELVGIHLDYAVDLIEGGYADYLKRHAYAEANEARYGVRGPRNPLTFRDLYGTLTLPRFSTDCLFGHPLIEREIHKVFKNIGGTFTAQIRHEKDHPLVAHKVLTGWSNGAGQTMLIAAMRCYVASKIGAEVEIPEGLI